MVAEERDDGDRAGGFDPRFDPAFQRGYQPQPGERPRTRVRSTATDPTFRRAPSLVRGREDAVPEPSEPVSAYDAAALSFEEDGPALMDSRMPAAVPAPPAAAASLDAPLAASAPGFWESLDVNPRRNPVLLALWIIGGGFVVLGIVLYCLSVATSYSGPTPTSDVVALVFAQLGWMLASPLITVGLLTLVALLFLTALAGRARAHASADGEL
jgi:hypothetical protein